MNAGVSNAARSVVLACLLVSGTACDPSSALFPGGSGSDGDDGNSAPMAVASAKYFGVIGDLITFDGTASLDPDGTIEKHLWTFEDGETIEGAVVERAFNESGSQSVTLTVTDNDGASSDHAASVAISSGLLTAVYPSWGEITPEFSPDVLSYTLRVPNFIPTVRFVPQVRGTATLSINGASAHAGVPSSDIELDLGDNTTDIEFNTDSGASVHYTIRVVRSLGIDYVKGPNPTAQAGLQAKAADASTLVLGSSTQNILYVFTRVGDAWEQQAILRGSNTEPDDSFGARVALSGDTLAVTAVGEDSNATGINGDELDNSAPTSGAVYVFTRSGGVWTQQAYIKASNTRADYGFGMAIGLVGDTLAVSSAWEDSKATGINGDELDTSEANSGAVYVFQRSGGVWVQEAYIKASNTYRSDLFGLSLSLDKDALAVGAVGEDSSSSGVNGDQTSDALGGSGAAYLFTRVDGTWTQEAYVKAMIPGGGDAFGYVVALSGNGLVVGAPNEASGSQHPVDNLAPGAGAAYYFARNGGTWSQVQYLKADSPSASAWFGSHVAFDGKALLVGATSEDTEAESSGAAYVFLPAGSEWEQHTSLKAPNPDASDHFGVISLKEGTLCISASGEDGGSPGVNGDMTDNSVTDSGAAYLY